MDKFCPKVESKCVGSKCAAFKTTKVMMKCEVCNTEFQLGGHADRDYDHKRVPVHSYSEHYCKEYSIKLKEINV